MADKLNKKGKLTNKTPRKGTKKTTSVTNPVTQTPEAPALQGIPVGKKPGKANQEPANFLSVSEPPAEEPEAAPEPPKIGNYGKPLALPEVKVTMMAPKDVALKRSVRAGEVAQEICENIQREVIEELFQSPDTPLFRFDLQSFPSDVKALVVNALDKAGWQFAYDGEQMIELGLPPVVPVALLHEKRKSSVRPL